jgi:hypothetical protein
VTLAVRHERDLREMVAAKLPKLTMARTLGVRVDAITNSLAKLELHHGGRRWSTRKYKTHAIIARLREERMNQCLTIDEL